MLSCTADDIVGKNESSDDGGDSDDDSDDDDDDNSGSDSEPPKKKSKRSPSRDKNVKKEDGESGKSSPGMTSEEVVSETQRQLKILQKRNNTIDST